MSIEALPARLDDAASRQVLRIALSGALGIALGTVCGVPLPFIAALIAVNSAATMRRIPPLGMLLVLVAIVFAVPYAFNLVSGAFLEYPYLLLAFIWLSLFYGFRLQANPRQRLIGVLVVAFAIIVPIVEHAANEIGPLFVMVLGLNVVSGLVAVAVAFAAFPERGEPTAAPAPTADGPASVASPGAHTLSAAISATVMIPLIAVFLSWDAVTALRVLFVASTVLAAVGSSEAERQSWIALASVGIGGLAAVCVSLVWIVLPSPIVGLLLGCLASLLIGRRAVEGPHALAYTGGIAAMWMLLATSGTDPAAKVFLWSLYAIAGACYAIAGRALLSSVFGRNP